MATIKVLSDIKIAKSRASYGKALTASRKAFEDFLESVFDEYEEHFNNFPELMSDEDRAWTVNVWHDQNELLGTFTINLDILRQGCLRDDMMCICDGEDDKRET
jgi:hypothetical protein